MKNLVSVRFFAFLLAFLSIIAINALHAASQTGPVPSSTVEHDMEIFYQLAKSHPEEAPFAAMVIATDKPNDQILCMQTNHNNTTRNPTLHAEIATINQCASQYPNIDWSKTVLITTAEPCAMCISAIMWAGIPYVYFGTSVPTVIKDGWGQINLLASQVTALGTVVHKVQLFTSSQLAAITDPLYIKNTQN